MSEEQKKEPIVSYKQYIFSDDCKTGKWKARHSFYLNRPQVLDLIDALMTVLETSKVNTIEDEEEKNKASAIKLDTFISERTNSNSGRTFDSAYVIVKVPQEAPGFSKRVSKPVKSEEEINAKIEALKNKQVG
ncbi:MAG: hypothetical protein GTN36_02725 [Candidatus Aenigmarchaeota archaeon]|nr:hypothetical protein [Candidatus Aenigmarchaeota archaeon]